MYYVGVDIGGMSIKVGIVDENGTIYNKKSFVTRLDVEPNQVMKELADFIIERVKEIKLSLKDIQGIGLGIPGTILNDTIRYSNNLNWNMVPACDYLADFLNYPRNKVFAENDANCAALGEVYCGVCKNQKHVVLITLGTGVGTGIITDGKLLVGNGACGGEGGHMVIHPNGALCTCGRKGCFESHASATALMRNTTDGIKANPNSLLAKIAEQEGKVSGLTVFNAYKQGDKVAKRIVNRYIKDIALGATNLANIFRPEAIVIGGGVSNQGEWFINAIQDLVDKEVYGGISVNPRVKVVKASLGNDAGIIGAAALAIYRIDID